MDWTGKLRALAFAMYEFRSSQKCVSWAYSKGMDHGFEAEVYLASADDLGHILNSCQRILLERPRRYSH